MRSAYIDRPDPMNADELRAAMPHIPITRRQLSWVAVVGPYFYKIYRRSTDVLADLGDFECRQGARREFDHATLLHSLDARAIAPVAQYEGCIVYPALRGPDMQDFLRHARRCEAAAVLRSAISTLAAFHRGDARATGIAEVDYARRSFVPIPAHVAARIETSTRTVVIGGFEVRNFRYDEARDDWFFFDPHDVAHGCPEEDLARLIISLLMISWRHSLRGRLWSRFDLRVLIAAYEDESRREIDPVLFEHFLNDITGMRRYHALDSVRAMRPVKSAVARRYAAIFFRQIAAWIRSNASGL